MFNPQLLVPVVAQSSSSDGGSAVSLIVIVAIFGGLFLFMSFRQRRRMRDVEAFLGTLAVGDEVRSAGGVLGTIERLEEDHVVLLSETTTLRLAKRAIVAREDTP